MISPRGPLRALPSPRLAFDDGGLPISDRFADSYFSRDGGEAESRHVFVDGNALPERMRERDRRLLTVAELGFGTGLNFLCCWDLLRREAAPGLRLHYWSIDGYPLRDAQLAPALSAWRGPGELADELRAVYPPPVAGVHRRIFAGGRVILDCVWSGAREALADLASRGTGSVDAWFLDGFAPRRNPDMWAQDLFADMARCSRPGATLASYSAAGAVRRGLAAAGFAVSKRPGFGSKRECIQGRLTAPAAAVAPAFTPWDLAEGNSTGAGDALVIGAGLAGAHVAAALARRGLQVTVLDAAGTASGASGNRQGVLFSRLSHQHSTLADFSLLASGYAFSLYRDLFRSGQLASGRDGELNGCLQLPGPRSNAAALRDALAELPELAVPMTAGEAAGTLGPTPAAAGFWQPRAGWLAPQRVCAALLSHPGIEVLEHCGRLGLRQVGDAWQAVEGSGTPRATAAVAVVAAGLGSRDFAALGTWLPLRGVRGQTSEVPAAGLPPLRASFCHSGYVTPALDGTYSIGATFGPGDERPDLRGDDHRENLVALAAALPAWRDYLERIDPATLAGRAAVRATAPDYLPLAGPVPDPPRFAARYAALAEDARQCIAAPAPVLRNCYLSTAFGSRGLSYAALCAELLASQITGEVPPLQRELLRAVSPARFLLRAIVRGTGYNTEP